MGTVDEKEEGGAVGVAPYESAVIAAVGGDLRKKCDEKYPVSFIKQLCWHEGEKKTNPWKPSLPALGRHSKRLLLSVRR